MKTVEFHCGPGLRMSDTSPFLKDHRFAELFFTNGHPVMVRGMQSAALGGLKVMGTVRIPDFLEGDARELHRIIVETSIVKKLREFGLHHQEVKYRCSMVAPPTRMDEFREPQLLEHFIRTANWCVRRIGYPPPELAKLNLPGRLHASIADLVGQSGLVLIGGSMGSGKTTTASAILRKWVQDSGGSAITLEDPPEFDMEGCFEGGGVIQQVEVDHMRLAEGLKYARRWAPRFILIGEVRTPEAASELLHIAISGPMVICTIHAADMTQTLASLIRYASTAMPESAAFTMLAASLKLIVHQKMSPGGVDMEMAKVYGEATAAIRSRIEKGNLGALQEEFDRQKINSMRARP